jgi:hypothetical protein
VGPPASGRRQPISRRCWPSSLLYSGGGSDPGSREPLPPDRYWICQESMTLESWPCRRGDLDPVGMPRAVPSTLGGPLTRTTRFRPLRCDIGSHVGCETSPEPPDQGPSPASEGRADDHRRPALQAPPLIDRKPVTPTRLGAGPMAHLIAARRDVATRAVLYSTRSSDPLGSNCSVSWAASPPGCCNRRSVHRRVGLVVTDPGGSG